MAIGVRARARVNRSDEFNASFILEESRAERATHRLQWIREPQLLTDIPQSNANLVVPGSAGRRYVPLDDVAPNEFSGGHGKLLHKAPAHRWVAVCALSGVLSNGEGLAILTASQYS